MWFALNDCRKTFEFGDYPKEGKNKYGGNYLQEDIMKMVGLP